MGCICFENPAMGIYFISDPDGYWIEIVPAKGFTGHSPKYDQTEVSYHV